MTNDPSESLLASPHGKGQNVTRSWLPLLEIPLPTVVQDRVDVQANSILVTLERQLLEWEPQVPSASLSVHNEQHLAALARAAGNSGSSISEKFFTMVRGPKPEKGKIA